MSSAHITKRTIYIMVSLDQEEPYRKRTLQLQSDDAKSPLSSLPSFHEYLEREFNFMKGSIHSIGVYSENIKDFVLLENNAVLMDEVLENSKIKLYLSPKAKPTLVNPLDSSVINYSYTTRLSDYDEEERLARIQLAAAYRLFDHFGWTDLIYNHLTARVGKDKGKPYFLLNPFGLLFNEITASSLVKVDIEGNIVDPGCTRFGINFTGYVIHSAIHSARDDIGSVMHCHSTAGVAVASSKCGLMSLTQNSAIVGNVSYHDYEGLAVNMEERETLKKDLGEKNKHMMLRNHGLLTCGTNIAEAFFNMFMFNRACEMQVAALTAGIDNLVLPPKETQQFTEKAAANFNQEGVGQKEFDALMRMLDRQDPSYRL